MKSFDEFIGTLDPNELSKIAAEAAENQLDAFAGASQASTAVTLELLRKYHEWLLQQLS